MTDISKLQLQIDELVASKTFSLDALDGIRVIRDGLREMTKMNETLKANYADLNAVNSRQSDLIQSLNKQIEGLKHDLQEARKMARDGELATHASKTSAAVADAYKDILHTIFRPSSVREAITRNVVKPVEGMSGGNGYSPTSGFLANGTETETITRTQE